MINPLNPFSLFPGPSQIQRERGAIDRMVNSIALLILFPILFPLYMVMTLAILPIYLMSALTHQFVLITSITLVGTALAVSLATTPAVPAVGIAATALIGLTFVAMVNRPQRIDFPSYFEMFG